MPIKANTVYLSRWLDNNSSFINVVTSVNDTHCFGYCIYAERNNTELGTDCRWPIVDFTESAAELAPLDDYKKTYPEYFI